MNKSNYFEVLASAYEAEIDDLSSDFEGKAVLSARLREKRGEIDTMLQMIDSAPEMVAPVFYGAFTFLEPLVLMQVLQAEPDDEDFPSWDAIAGALRLADWAEALVRKFLHEPGGELFMVSVAAVEFLRIRELSRPESSREAVETEKKTPDEDADGDDQDLAEIGADWLTEQGFDARSI